MHTLMRKALEVHDINVTVMSKRPSMCRRLADVVAMAGRGDGLEARLAMSDWYSSSI